MSRLYATTVASAKPRDREYKLGDGAGLYLLVKPNGRKLWRLNAHGFRAMAATLLNEMGIWNPDAIERQLAHMESNGIRRAYTRGEYWDERVRMMQHWSNHLDELRDGARILKPKFGGR